MRDFGPIARADIDLRPLTVFVGPSNTGKSYLAILIYALHRFFYDYSSSPVRLHRLSSSTTSPGTVEENTEETIIHKIIDWLDRIPTGSESSKRPVGRTTINVPNSIKGAIAPLLQDVENFEGVLSRELARCFGTDDPKRLIRHESRKGAYVSAKRQILGESGLSEPFEYSFTVKGEESEVFASIPDDAPMPLAISSEEVEALKERRLYVGHIHDTPPVYFGSPSLVHDLRSLVESYLLRPINQPIHYLPADRAGVMHAHRVVVGSLIQRAPYAGIQREEPLPLLSGVLADFLKQLNELDTGHLPRGIPQWSSYISPYDPKVKTELATRIEQNILGGTVHYETSVTGYPVFSYQPYGWKEDMPLMNTSSMVSELAPVALYLRHVVQPGETLIIEEPESHLHPAMQVEFTRQLAAVVRAGVRVIITTHSEWVLEELANLVNLSGLPESRREGIGGADYALSPDQLGVWLFEPKNRPRGSVVKEIPFDKDFGGFRSGFDVVSMGTYNDYAAISNRLEEIRS